MRTVASDRSAVRMPCHPLRRPSDVFRPRRPDSSPATELNGLPSGASRPRDPIPHLLARGVLDANRVAADAFRVIDASRRNRVHGVEADEGQSYLVKSPIEADAAASLAIERDVLVALVGTRRFLRTPQVLDWDAGDPRPSSPTSSTAPTCGPTSIARPVARRPPAGRQIAGALAELHAIDWAPAAGARGNLLSRAPWILELDAPDISVEATLSAAGIELIRIAQASGLAGELAQLRLRIRRPWFTTTSVGTTGPCDADDVRSCSSTWKWLAWATPHGTSDRRSRAA